MRAALSKTLIPISSGSRTGNDKPDTPRRISTRVHHRIWMDHYRMRRAARSNPQRAIAALERDNRNIPKCRSATGIPRMVERRILDAPPIQLRSGPRTPQASGGLRLLPMIPSQFITKWTDRGFGDRHAAQICFLNVVNENYEARPGQ